MNKRGSGSRRVQTLRVAAVIAVCALAACHPRRSAGTAQAPVDPCTLLTRADAERALGVPVEPARRRDTVLMATGRECDYVAVASATSSVNGRGIDLTVYDDASVRSPDSMFKSAADYFRRDMAALRSSGTSLVAVSNLGEVAYWQPGAGLLHVLDRGVYVVLDVETGAAAAQTAATTGSPAGPTSLAAEISLARRAILPRIDAAASPTQPPPFGGGTRGRDQ